MLLPSPEEQAGAEQPHSAAAARHGGCSVLLGHVSPRWVVGTGPGSVGCLNDACWVERICGGPLGDGPLCLPHTRDASYSAWSCVAVAGGIWWGAMGQDLLTGSTGMRDQAGWG